MLGGLDTKGLAMTMLLSRLKYLVAACVLALTIGVAKADIVYVTDLSVSLVRSDIPYEWVSQTFTLQDGATVDFGTAILYADQGSCQGTFCSSAGVPYAYRVLYGPAPTTSYLIGLLQDMTDQGAIDACAPGGPCLNKPPSPPIDLTFTLPSNQDSITLAFLSFAEPTITPPAVPLPATLPLFATGFAGLGLLGWRRKRAAAG
jgi:hypothetical protein